MMNLLIFLISFVYSAVSDHAIYISVVEINYHSKTGESSFSIKVFTNDLQDASRNFSSDYVPKSADQFLEFNEEIVGDYFNENLLIKVNNEELQLELTSFERENDAHFLYFKMESVEVWKQMEITGSFFSELFPNQSNIVTIKYNNKKYFARLTKSNPDYSVTFD